MARSPKGPWLTPRVDTFDTRCFYAAKHGTDGTEHFMYGWNPTREKNLYRFDPQEYDGMDYNTWDWGGTKILPVGWTQRISTIPGSGQSI
jgi:beta-fructofuranosidase